MYPSPPLSPSKPSPKRVRFSSRISIQRFQPTQEERCAEAINNPHISRRSLVSPHVASYQRGATFPTAKGIPATSKETLHVPTALFHTLPSLPLESSSPDARWGRLERVSFAPRDDFQERAPVIPTRRSSLDLLPEILDSALHLVATQGLPPPIKKRKTHKKPTAKKTVPRRPTMPPSWWRI